MAKAPDPKRTLLSYINIQKDHDRQLYRLLNRAASDVDRQLKSIVGDGIGARIRRDQLMGVKRAMYIELESIMSNAGYVIQALKYKAAAAAIKAFQLYEEVLFTALPSEQHRSVAAYLASAKETARTGIASAEQRLLGASYRPLAESVYDTLLLQRGVVDRTVESALARGLSARELAKEATALIKPNVAGGVSYAAMRLGRTELNNAFHATSAQAARQSPFVEGVIWHLSGSHPRPDECNEYAANAVEGEPAGFFAPDDIPSKPHPQCLCYTTPVTVSEAAFLDRFFAGDYDSYLSRVTGI